jgi:hypothetical protein
MNNFKQHSARGYSRDLVPLDVLQNTLSPPQHPLYHMAGLPPSPPYLGSSASPPPPESRRSLTHDRSSPGTPAELSNSSDSSGHRCLWIDCTKAFSDPETLYNHLCNDHIGRKSTNNLCLTCKWKDCGTTCAKRDHITSHLRGTFILLPHILVTYHRISCAVHTPLKPHICEICSKSFKRPQDLKKHEKIHTEEHHAQHKHSKAITVVDPAYVSRVRGEPVNKGPPLTSSNLKVPSDPPKSRSTSASDFGVLPTPSPEMHPSSVHHPHTTTPDGYIQTLPSWEVLRPEVSVGSKRSHEYSVDDFFSDMKKRRVSPSYDPREFDCSALSIFVPTYILH